MSFFERLYDWLMLRSPEFYLRALAEPRTLFVIIDDEAHFAPTGDGAHKLMLNELFRLCAGCKNVVQVARRFVCLFFLTTFLLAVARERNWLESFHEQLQGARDLLRQGRL